MQDAWGLDFARKAERRRIMEREKKRRQRAAQAAQAAAMASKASVVVLRRPRFDVFVTVSGMLAVRPRHARSDGGQISLPYVAFIHGPVSIEGERIAA